MRVIRFRRVYNTFAFQSCDLEVPAVGTGSTSTVILASLQDCQNNFIKIVANIGLMLVTVINIIVVSVQFEIFPVK